MKSMLALLACAGCATTARPAEVVRLPTAPQPGPWLVLRDTLIGCARDHGLTGDLTVRLDIDQDGGVGGVISLYGDAYAACVGRNVGRSRYRGYRSRMIEVPFTVTAPAAWSGQ